MISNIDIEFQGKIFTIPYSRLDVNRDSFFEVDFISNEKLHNYTGNGYSFILKHRDNILSTPATYGEEHTEIIKKTITAIFRKEAINFPVP